MRRDWATRAIANCDEVEQFLRAEGFTITDAATLPFLEQVRMFQSAQLVFGVIGSGFTGSYSPTKYGSWQLDPPPGGIIFLCIGATPRWTMVRGPRPVAMGWQGPYAGRSIRDICLSSPRWPQ